MTPRRAQHGPRQLPDGQEWPQDRPKTAQDASKMPPRWPKMPSRRLQDGPRCLPKGPIWPHMAPRPSKMDVHGPRWLPKSPKTASILLQNGPRWLQVGSQMARGAAGMSRRRRRSGRAPLRGAGPCPGGCYRGQVSCYIGYKGGIPCRRPRFWGVGFPPPGLVFRARRPRWPQMVPEMLPRPPKMPSRSLQDCPRCLQEPPRWPKMAPGQAKMAPGRL